jgi:hypothetical protein
MADRAQPGAPTHAPSLITRLAWWFAIYFASYLWLLRCWPGELHHWTSPFSVPDGLLSALRLMGPDFESELQLWAVVAYGIYFLLFVLCAIAPNRASFWKAMAVFILVSCLSSYGFGWCQGIISSMSN